MNLPREADAALGGILDRQQQRRRRASDFSPTPSSQSAAAFLSSSAVTVPSYRETLHPPTRRWSSAISFERHGIEILSALADELDDDEDDSIVENDDDEEEWEDLRRCRDEEDEHEENPVVTADDDDGWEDALPRNRSLQDGLGLVGPPIAAVAVAERRVSELTLDLEDIREAAEVACDDEDRPQDEDDDHPPHSIQMTQHRSSFRRSSFRSASSSYTSVVGRIQEDIIADAIAKGKLFVQENDHHESDRGGIGINVAPTATMTTRPCRSSFSSSGASSSYFPRRRVLFARRGGAAATDAAAAEAGGGGSGSLAVAAPSAAAAAHGGRTVQDNILAALRELGAGELVDDMPIGDGKTDENSGTADPKKTETSESSKAPLLELRDNNKDGNVCSSGGTASPTPLDVKMMELSAPPPGTRPRRSSFRRLEDRQGRW